MININNVSKLKSLLSDIFYIGLNMSYSYEYIEERICSSSFIKSLEDNNDDSFLYNANSISIAQEIYPRLEKYEIQDLINNTNPLSLWLGEVYFGLFFKYHKSFPFIFLYMPLSLGIYSFDAYHEMDFSQFYSFFKELTNKDTIIEKLLKKNDFNYEQLSVLSGIKKSTLVNYSRNNENIYNAKYETLYTLSKLFNVNINVFAKDIFNEPVAYMYKYNKEDPVFRSALGLLFCKYYDKEIRNTDFDYDPKNNIYKEHHNPSFQLKVIWTEYKEGQGLTFPNQNENIIKAIDEYIKSLPKETDINKHNLVVFEFDGLTESIDYFLSLKNRGFNNIFIINQRYFFQINKNIYRYKIIDNRVNEFLIQRARVIQK